MRDRQLYEYSIIRLVPKVERGEFINIGLILLSKESNFLSMKYEIDEVRIRTLSEDVDLDLIRAYMTGWQKVCEGGSKGGKIGELEIRVRFRWLTANRSTIIQSAPVHPGFCDHPAQELERLFAKFVL